MDTTRQLKVARLIQKEMGEMFQRDLAYHFPGVLITVTKIRVSPDLSYVKAYLSIFGNTDKNSIIKKANNELSKDLRGKMGNRIGKQLRITPEFEFFLDDSADYAARIDELLKK
ncbi:MAG: 30S ribosome-binding factor RbfA [Bacteroidia bacterium]|nr:30S ribosome-binding factor RbfA [Bacteroidia bacterium]MCZ2249509.1 30S ribosome-binding factor RbfA [Bacteroidia bacterium]